VLDLDDLPVFVEDTVQLLLEALELLGEVRSNVEDVLDQDVLNVGSVVNERSVEQGVVYSDTLDLVEDSAGELQDNVVVPLSSYSRAVVNFLFKLVHQLLSLLYFD